MTDNAVLGIRSIGVQPTTRQDVVHSPHINLFHPRMEHPENEVTHGELALEIVFTEERFVALQREWDLLVDRSSATVFQSFDWLYSWWIHFGAGHGRTLHILLFRSGGRLVGAAPFFIILDPIGRFPYQGSLQFLGCGVANNRGMYEHFAKYSPSDFLDIIAADSYELDVARMTASYLTNSIRGYLDICLVNVPETGIVFNYLLPLFDTGMFDKNVTRSDNCPQLSNLTTVDGFLNSLKPGVRRKLLQARNSFSGDSIGSIEPVTSSFELDKALELLVEMHQRRWNALGYPGLFSDRRFLLFQKEIASRFMRKGYLWLKIARYNGNPVAVRLVYRMNGRMYDYLSAFDPTLPGANRRPGFALLMSMVEDGIMDGVTAVELLRGDEQYKLDLSSNSTCLWTVRLRDRDRKTTALPTLAAASRILDSVRTAVEKELYLAKIQYHQHGPALFLLTYSLFALRRLLNRRRQAPVLSC